MIKKIVIVFLLGLLSNSIWAQSESSEILIRSSQLLPHSIVRKPSQTFSLERKGSTEESLQHFLRRLWNDGFLESSIDSVIRNDDRVEAYLTLGRQFYWMNLKLEEKWIGDLPGKLIPGTASLFSLKQFAELQNHLLHKLENQGYPFVSLHLDSVEVIDTLIRAKLLVGSGMRIYFDSLIVRTDLGISPKVLSRITGIKKGSWYQEDLLKKAQKRMNSSRLIRMNQAPEVGFFEDKAWVYMSPLMQKTNRIDGVAGIIPSSGSGFLALTGEFNLALNNLWHQAESFSVHWKAPGSGTQKFQAQLAFPYLFGWPLGFLGQLDIYRFRSLYLNLGATAGIRLTPHPSFSIDLLWEARQSSSLQNTDQIQIQPFELNLSKLGVSLDTRDFLLNPTRGYFVSPMLAYGRKTRILTPEENQTDNYWEAGVELEAYQTLVKSWVTKTALKAGFRSGDLSANESYRLGGFALLRGFQEESLTANSFAVGSAEIRFLFSGASNFHAFFDYGILSSENSDEMRTLTNYYAPGIGLNLQTRAGILRIDYAIGQIKGIPFNFQNGLVHLGIQSIF